MTGDKPISSVIKLKSTGYRVEKNVPIPRRHGRQMSCPFPFMDMSVGDSFFVTGVSQTVTGRLNRWWTRFSKENPEGGYKFTGRTVPGGVRCWRVK